MAYLVGEARADLGVMLSASHNPMPDNGIKLFAAGGHKLPDEIETQIEAAIAAAATATAAAWRRPTGAAVGRVHDLLDGARPLRQAPGRLGAAPRWTGSRSSSTAPTAPPPRSPRRPTGEAGAEVIAIHAEPDGLNINDGCGSTHLDAGAGRGARARRRTWASPTTATPTGAWRSTADGEEVDGDQIMAILALAMRDAGTLTEDTLVATVMSNLGLRHRHVEGGHPAGRDQGRRPVRAGGAARRAGSALGGEQSGHVVLPAYATTGDGVLTGLHLMARMAATGRAWPSWPSVVTKLPQVLINVPVGDRAAGADAPGGAGRGRPRPRPSWAAPAGCCCARPAPSRWCG